MKLTLPLLASSCAALLAAPAFADSINFAQFGPQGTSVSNGATGTTYGGDTFTISDSGAGFSEYIEDYSHTVNGGGYTWAGEFANGETILFNNADTGLTTISFATPVSSIQDVEAQANDGGAYTATLTAYSGTTDLGSVSYDAINNPGDPAVEGTIPNLNFYGSGITSFTITTTNNGGGFALGGVGGLNNPPPPISGVPEPSTWLLMLAGIGGIGLALRKAKKVPGFQFKDGRTA